MSTNTKRAAALMLLAKTGIWRSNYEPPLVRLLWRLGIDVPPPHFAKFWLTALFAGCFFAVAWGFVMWLLLWSRQGVSAGMAAASAAAAGLLFGLAMASYYAYGRRKHRLPPWEELADSP